MKNIITIKRMSNRWQSGRFAPWSKHFVTIVNDDWIIDWGDVEGWLRMLVILIFLLIFILTT